MTNLRRTLVAVGAVGGLFLSLAAVATPAAQAAPAALTLNVTTTADTNPATAGDPCASTSVTTPPSPLSLRQAVCVANNIGGAAQINVPAGTYTLTFGELDLGTETGQDVTVTGSSPTPAVINGGNASRVLNLDENLVGSESFTLSNLTIENGLDNTFGGAGIIAGAGNSAPDSLALTDDTLTNNNANTTPSTDTATDNPGGGLQFIGGNLTITDSTFSGNAAGSSNGSAIAYEAIGTSGQGFSMTGSTIKNNSGNNKAGNPSIYTDGAVSVGAPSGSVPMTITDSTFTGNSVTDTTGPGRGAGVTLEAGSLSVTNSSFSGNSLSGAGVGGALAVASGALAAHQNRMVGDTAGAGSGVAQIGGSVTATDNWWGCNAGPGGSGCDTVSGTATTNPRLTLTGAAVTVQSSGTATVSATMTQDSGGTTVSGSQPEFDTVPVVFGAPTPSATSCTGAPPTFTGGTATATCTLHGNGTEGPGAISVTVDNQTIGIPITVDKAPAITTNPSDTTVQAGQTATFTAAADGYPTPTVQWQVSTDGGSTFTNVSSATSTTLSFTATAGMNGNEYQAIFTNSTGSATTSAATLTVQQPPSFTSPDTATFSVGDNSTFDITTSGLPDATVSVSGGTLPTGLTFTAGSGGTATISGTPAAGSGGQYVVTLDAANGVSPDATQTLTITVLEAPRISSADQTTFAVGSAGSFTVTTDRGYPAPALSESGALPSGVTFVDNGDGTATLAGTPAAGTGGAYPITITAADGTSPDAVQDFTLTVDEAPTITSADHTSFALGSAGSFTVTTAAGYPVATAISETGALPSGVTFVDNGDGTATLAGTPAGGSDGSYPITITPSNSAGDGPSQSFTLTVTAVPLITSADDTTFHVGTAGSFTVTTTPGFPPGLTLTETGALPGGVTFTDNGDGTATLAGTPDAGSGGTYSVTIRADNGVGHTDQAFTLTVDEAPSITSADNLTTTVGQSSDFTVTTTAGYPTTTTVRVTGALPSGMFFFPDDANGTATLTGTPDAGTGGQYPLTITASNGNGDSSTQSFTLTVDEAPSFTTPDHTTFTVGQDGNFDVTIDPGYPSLTSIVVGGTTPTGVSTQTIPTANGATIRFSGTPAAGAGGTYVFSLSAGNGAGLIGTQTFTLTVAEAPAITSADNATFTAGTAGSFTVTSTGFPPAALSESGALPAGVSFVDNGDGTATLSGTPEAGTGGSWPFTITAANGTTPDATQSFTLTVNEAPAITSADHTTFASGQAGTFTVAANGFPTTALSESGSLPSGVTFVDNGDGTATLAGTPGAGSAGDYPITITASNGIGSDATQSFTLTVTSLSQTITFTSTPPTGAVVGETYPVAATGGGSGNPVEFAIDPSATSVCSISGSTVRFDHPGTCLIDATQDGDAQYAPGAASQSVAVGQAATTTAVAVNPTTIVATVAPVPPGAGTPTGTVTFSVDGTSVGSAPLVGGVATLTDTVPAGKTRNVSAVYGGDTDFAGSSGSTARHDPRIRATLSSAHPRTRFGWYRSPVTVTFHCTPEGAPLTAACPAPVTLHGNGGGQSVTRTIQATDGGAATVAVRGINIDKTKPTVSIAGVKNGKVYSGTAPKPRCVAKDALSGIATCRLTTSTHKGATKVTATATDKAGNARSTSVTYRVTEFYVLGQRLVNGAYQLKQGHAYTLVALIPGSTRPWYYDAAPLGQTPRPMDKQFNRAGRQSGLNRYTLVVHIDQGLGRYQYWVMGIKVGKTMHLIKFHPLAG